MMKTTTAPTADVVTDPTLTFWGAAQAVTGSMHLFEVGNQKVLLDCGLYQGRRDEARVRNSRFPFHPHQIDAVVLSHAHVDHCGNLPTLVRQGFHGPIYCTPATRSLLEVMLADSARIQEEDAAHLNIQRHYAEPWVQPLYTQGDVRNTLDLCVGVPYEKDREIIRDVHLRFLDAGHILGSAMVYLRVTADGRERTLLYTGDLGRRGIPFLRETAPLPATDVIACESTYGGRLHEPIEDTAKKLWDAVRRTIARGGKVLIPAFSLGRTQLIVHYLRQGIRQNQLPAFPVYVDSPLAADIAGVYREHTDCLDPALAASMKDDPEFLGSDTVRYVRSFEESLLLSTRPGPCVLVASSGMCDSGRIVHHLKHNVDDPRCTIILVSYQAHGTTGRRLLEPKPTVRFLNRDWNKWTEVVHLDGFSGHADKTDFLAYLGPLVGKTPRVRLIHGEREQAGTLAQALREIGFTDVSIPESGDFIRLT
jgi:metallo-beta-lactamase family protein